MNSIAPTTNGPTATETLFGGTELIVKHMDGMKESVRILQLRTADMPALLASQDDDVAIACLYTGKDAAWFNRLDAESQELIAVEGDRINLDFFVRWFERKLKRQERLMPGVTEKALAQVGAAERKPSVNIAPQLRRLPA